MATELRADRAERPRAGERVEAPIARAGRRRHDPAEDAFRLLRGVAGLLPAGRRDDRVPPDIRGELAARGLLRSDEPGRHVRLALDGLGVEPVAVRVLDVDQDRVVLRRPATPRPGTVVVGPDDLVEEALPAEELVEQHLGVVRLPVVEMEVERPRRVEQPVDLAQPRLQEAEVVLEGVRVRGGAQHARRIAAPAEPGPVAVGVLLGRQGQPALPPPRVERRVGVDELEATVLELWEDDEVVPVEDQVLVERHPASLRR